MKLIKSQYLVYLSAALLVAGRAEEHQEDATQKDSGAPAVQQRDSKSGELKAQADVNVESREKEGLNASERNQQSTFRPGAISESELKNSVAEINKASSFIGMQVQNLENERLGKVADLVFDPNSGKVSYVVLSIGGLLGIGDKLIAVPLSSLKPRPGQDHLVLNMDRQQLQNAPGLAQNNWPPLNSPGLGGPAGSEQQTETEEKP
jgi:sporulation protein YlmC with PRC-barrel domain